MATNGTTAGRGMLYLRCTPSLIFTQAVADDILWEASGSGLVEASGYKFSERDLKPGKIKIVRKEGVNGVKTDGMEAAWLQITWADNEC